MQNNSGGKILEVKSHFISVGLVATAWKSVRHNALFSYDQEFGLPPQTMCM